MTDGAPKPSSSPDTLEIDESWDDPERPPMEDATQTRMKPQVFSPKVAPARRMLPTLPDFDPLAHDLDEDDVGSRMTLPVIDPARFDKPED